MNLENPTSGPNNESEHQVKIETKSDFESFIPEEFKQDPIKYFEEQGHNIKSGEIKRDETGRIREDPAAVKELPTWTNENQQELKVVGKKVNVEKGKVGESGDPFYEYRIIETVQSLGLPTIKPIAKTEQGDNYLILTEKATGIGWYTKDLVNLQEKGFNVSDIENLKNQAKTMIEELQKQFEEAGITRGWKEKDMIFDIDFENKTIKSITPTDWERTKIDYNKLEEYKNKLK